MSFNCIATQNVSETLTLQITNLINSSNDVIDSHITHTVKILTPENQLEEICSNPELSLAGNNARISGNKSIVIQCGSVKKFIQIVVHSEGSWWEALHALQAGHTITHDDIQLKIGSIDHLPAGIILNSNNIIGQTTTRYINKGQPLTDSLLRKTWAIVAGHSTEVLAKGSGFKIRTRGQALDSASAGQAVRISLASGRILTGQATADGQVNIFLKE